MKLQTSIKPRADGVVLLTGDDGEAYTFTPDVDGNLVAEVPHEPTVARLLALGDFYPADPADNAAAIELVQTLAPAPADAHEEGDDPVDMNALPVEANTPPAGGTPAHAE